MIDDVKYESLAIENKTSEEEILQENAEITTDNNFDSSESLDIENNNDNYINDETTVDNKINNSEETNCLALTVRKDYGLFIFKNGLVKTFRVTCKVAFCTFFLNLLTLLL